MRRGLRALLSPHFASSLPSPTPVVGARAFSAHGSKEHEPIPKYDGPHEEDYWVQFAHKRGMDVLNDPIYNRGFAYNDEQRERLNLRGLLPPIVRTIEEQTRLQLDYFKHGLQRRMPPPEAGISSEDIRKWQILRNLHDRNETLYYKLIVDHFPIMAPIIYTPTVGWAAINYSSIQRRPRGMYFTKHDVGEMSAMLWNYPRLEVDAIVVTDGSRILGLGDQGIQGMAIPIGKLDLYVAGGGFHPDRCLPVAIDVGTDNEALLADPEYIGLKERRLKGAAYYKVIDEFVSAVMARWPNAVLQFEDFSTDVALDLLERYRTHHCMFNDDIQGTAATALAGMFGAMRALGKKKQALNDQRFLVCGAGSAGMGVVDMIRKAMIRMGLSPEAASERFYILDGEGLITTKRRGLASHVTPFMQKDETKDRLGLVETIKYARPTVMLGLTGAGKIWTQEVLETIGKVTERPILFPMSNPISKMECSSEEAQQATGGRAIFASGSPQPNVTMGDKILLSSQANNMFIFPGLALGAALARATMITDPMIMAAAESLPDMLPDHIVQNGGVYPQLDNIRDISAHVALATMRQAVACGTCKNDRLKSRLMRKSTEEMIAWIRTKMYKPLYGPIVQLPPGINE